jgi:ATP-dependent exoDNAse (exonuclease V) beta subunit
VSKRIGETVIGKAAAERAPIQIPDLLEESSLVFWQNGEQALANCQRFIDMARHFERGASSFRAFIESVEEEAEHGEVNEAPIVEEGTEGVGVMTVYKAKGLEFPVPQVAIPLRWKIRHLAGTTALRWSTIRFARG